jgi:AraC-like DNA-binding protein
LRLRKAADLLAHAGERRISDIAFDCGFNDLSYFNRCFRRRFGAPPTQFRGRTGGSDHPRATVGTQRSRA